MSCPQPGIVAHPPLLAHRPLLAHPPLLVCHRSQARITPSYSNNETLALSKRTESTSGSSPHWTTYVFGISAMMWGLNGLIMQHVAHRLNVAKWEAEKREKREKAEEDRPLKEEVDGLRRQVWVLAGRIVELERENAKLRCDVTDLQGVALDNTRS